jgi:hypothetical protein
VKLGSGRIKKAHEAVLVRLAECVLEPGTPRTGSRFNVRDCVSLFFFNTHFVQNVRAVDQLSKPNDEEEEMVTPALLTASSVLIVSPSQQRIVQKPPKATASSSGARKVSVLLVSV